MTILAILTPIFVDSGAGSGIIAPMKLRFEDFVPTAAEVFGAGSSYVGPTLKMVAHERIAAFVWERWPDGMHVAVGRNISGYPKLILRREGDYLIIQHWSRPPQKTKGEFFLYSCNYKFSLLRKIEKNQRRILHKARM